MASKTARQEWRLFNDHRVFATTEAAVVRQASAEGTVALYVLDDEAENLQQQINHI